MNRFLLGVVACCLSLAAYACGDENPGVEGQSAASFDEGGGGGEGSQSETPTNTGPVGRLALAQVAGNASAEQCANGGVVLEKA